MAGISMKGRQHEQHHSYVAMHSYIEEREEYGPAEIKTRVTRERSFAEEHWLRCPARKRDDGQDSHSWANDEGCGPALSGAQILFYERILTVYNVTADMVVSGMIIRKQDPGWFDAAYYCMMPPIIAKLVLLNRHCMAEFERRKFLSHEAWALYLVLGPWFYVLSDYYLLLFYPWVRPSHGKTLVQEFERLSPLLEGVLQTLFQIGFHLYLWFQFRHEDTQKRYADSSLHMFLPFSILPAMFFFVYSMSSLWKDSQRVGLGLVAYVLELIKAPLLRGRAPLYELLSTQQEVSFEGLGKLTLKQQESIFDAISCDQNCVLELYFDDENAINFGLCAERLKLNTSLQRLSLGKELTFYDVLALLQPLEEGHHQVIVAFCDVQLTHQARSKWLARAAFADPGNQKAHRVAAWFVHHEQHIRKAGVGEPSTWPLQSFEKPETFGEIGQLALLEDRRLKRKDPVELAKKTHARAKYGCCVGASDGNIYAIPFNAEQVLKVDPKTGICAFVGPKLSGKMKYECCIEHNGLIYCIPYDAQNVLAFDFDTKVLNSKYLKPDFVGESVPGQWKYSCCELHEDTIYGIPRDGQYILAVDTLKHPKTRRFVGAQLPQGSGKYLCCAKGDDGIIYGIPYNAEQVLALDPTNGIGREVIELIGESFPATCKYECCIKGHDGKIYGIPSSADQILMVDPSNKTVSQVGKCLPGNGKYSCCSLGPYDPIKKEYDSKIYAFPKNAEQILAFDPTTGECALVGEPLDGEWKYTCCALGDDGIIYAMPNNANHVLAFDPKTQRTTRVGYEIDGISKYYCCWKADSSYGGKIYGIPHDASSVLSFNPSPHQLIVSL